MSRASIMRRLNAIALSQLCERAAALAVENDELRAQASDSEQWAESWRDDYLALCESINAQPGITINGRLRAVGKS